jgi:hypothetical protein
MKVTKELLIILAEMAVLYATLSGNKQTLIDAQKSRKKAWKYGK